MGYDVHITRRKHWVDDDGPEITLDEWLELLKLDPDIRLDGFAEATVDGSTLRVEAPGLAVWTNYSGDGVNGNHAWFYWSRGDISVKNPDVEILRKMHSISQALAAAVQGDDGEFYDSEGKPMHSDGDGGMPKQKPWWRFW